MKRGDFVITEERHKLILDIIAKKGIVKLNEFVEITGTSESTIRRDLTYLESVNALKRVHGGATLLKSRYTELSYNEKLNKNINEKSIIARYAASLIQKGDCIYMDAGTTTFEMIKYINIPDVVVVTNGLKHIDALVEKGINSYILGGKVRAITKAIIGIDTLKNLEKFRFDKAFMGINGIHYQYGYTTPDAEEAAIKEAAINLSKETYILADESKFGEVSFCKVSEIIEASIITNAQVENIDKYQKLTNIKVVSDNDLYYNI
jgi:DeoR family transcriptional regulator, fructose operon transcriptional repressor